MRNDFIKKIENLNSLINFEFDDEIKTKLINWYDIFVEYNNHTNLVSKNEIKNLFEKHVFDSLSIINWKDFLNITSVLDVGCGGGFPSVILAICFPDKKIIANDSRIKKINFIKIAKEKLKLDNLEIAYSRVEELEELNVELIVSRAVGDMLNVFELSKKHLIKKGKFLIYKSKTSDDEILKFKKKYKKADFKIIEYKLPLEENYERKLILLD